MFATRFLNKDVFENYDDYVQNAVPNVPDNFNFAYDVIDEIAKETPDKVAIIWTDDSGETKTFTYRDISRHSNMIANFLTDRGIKRGDTVLLFMRRRWEYWILMMAMHKLFEKVNARFLIYQVENVNNMKENSSLFLQNMIQ